MSSCRHGNFPAAIAALADGAHVQEMGLIDDTGHGLGFDYQHSLVKDLTPLQAAVAAKHRPLIVHLLSLGATPDFDTLLHAIMYSSVEHLQLLADAGADLNDVGHHKWFMFRDDNNDARSLLYQAVTVPMSRLIGGLVMRHVVEFFVAQPDFDLDLDWGLAASGPETCAARFAKENGFRHEAAMIRAEVRHRCQRGLQGVTFTMSIGVFA